MNSPTVAEGIVDAEFEHLPLTTIAPSETTSQTRRRKRYTAASIAAFAKNIVGTRGIVEPIIVRRLAAMRGLASYELIAGERRWLASMEAGFAHIPALIRDVPDADLSLLQLSENLQRESIAPFEEAEALDDLIKIRGIDKDAAADLVGKSLRHVYNRLKLLKLKYQGAIDALEEGRLDPTKAIQIARYPTEKVQKRAFEMIGDESISLRQGTELLRDKLMVRLDEAPFDVADETFCTSKPGRFACQDSAQMAMPACVNCSICSDADPELQEQVIAWYGRNARVCTDQPCHDFKVKTFFEHRVAEARANGLPIIEGHEALKLRATLWSDELIGYIDLDAQCSEVEMPQGLSEDERADWQPPSYRVFLGADAIVSAVMIDPKRDGQPRELMAYADAKKALKKKGVKLAPEPEQHDSGPASARPGATPEEIADHQRELEAQKERQEKELAFRRRIGSLIYSKWKGKLTRADWELIAEECLGSGAGNMIANALFDGEINLSECSERDLQAICLLAPHAQTLAWHQTSPSDMLALAKRLKIDAIKVRKQVKAELVGKGVK